MNTSLVGGRLMAVAVLALGAVTWGGCSKEQTTPPSPADAGATIPEAGQRAPGDLFFTYTNPTTTFYFTVWKGCNDCYGQCSQYEVIPTCCPVFPIEMISQTPTTVSVSGSCINSSTECIFNKPSSNFAKGITYYLVPNEGGSSFATRKKLQFRFKYAPVVPLPTCGWFNYDVTTNTWTAAPFASNYFVWAQVTALPVTCC